MTGTGAGNRTPVPCQRDPERWFDAADRQQALIGCLSCRRRSWCAKSALSGSASFGMWAGVWIDDNLSDMTGLLEDIAAGTAPGDRLAPRGTQPRRARASTDPAAAPPQRLAVNRQVLAVVAARSSGHCELMTPHCRYTFDTIGSRIHGRTGWTAGSASEVYAVCRPCQAAIADAEPVFAKRLGYLVDPAFNPAYTAFYWRNTRWVYLDGGSRICPLESIAELVL